jgi:hypothetical protein
VCEYESSAFVQLIPFLKRVLVARAIVAYVMLVDRRHTLPLSSSACRSKTGFDEDDVVFESHL